MASIFEQYEATMSKTPGSRRVADSHTSIQEPISSGYINTRLEDDVPIFNKSKINFQPTEPITHLTICNNMLYMVMSGKILMRINLLKPDDADEIVVTRGNDKVYKLFLDPTGHFLLITLTTEETLFMSSYSQKPKSLNKFKGHKLESVAWCRTSSGNTTGPILIGTSWGLIMESSIEAGEETKFFGGSVDQYFKQVYNFGKGEGKGSSVFGLEYFCTAARDNGRNDYCIFATTPSRLFQFSGTLNVNSGDVPVFSTIFASYQKTPPRCTELSGFLDHSQLMLLHDTSSPATRIPSQFAWLAHPGVYVGQVKSPQVGDESALPQRSLISNAKLISYPEPTDSNPFADPDECKKVLNVVLTEFHILLLYADRVKVICVLNEQIIFEDIYTSRYGHLVGLIKDPSLGTIWAYTERAVFKYKVVKEARDVWQMYLNMGKFELAREFCRDNPANLDKVLTRQAEDAFAKEMYQESAMYYAITRNSFEETALRFIRVGQEAALRTFLQKKLSTLKAHETIQITMLSTWLVELHLNNLGKLKENDDPSNLEALRKARDSLRKLLSQNKLKESFHDNRSTIYNLLISYGDIEDYIFFAVLMQDYERVVNHYIQNNNYKAAIDALQKQQNNDLYYKFSPVLMQHIPKETVDAWIEVGRGFEPRQLIPALVNSTQTNPIYKDQWLESIRYLEYCISHLNCTDQAIHNYLISLYIKHKPEAVLKYLKDQGDDMNTVCYDTKYALRLCLGDGNEYTNPVLHRACVIIYTVLKLYEEAVTMALKVDVDLAKSIADRELEDEDEELKKKLWLRIAKHVVQEDKDIKRAMKFLQDSGDLLKIEDILPFFPDFVTIDHFKDALCEALAEYNKQIDELKEEMNDASASAEAIRGNIQETKNRHLVVGETERCASCDKQLLSKAFYIFPCEHSFHSDCFWREVRPLLDELTRAEADRLYQDISAMNQSAAATSEDAQRQRRLARQKLLNAFDEVIANECAYCGEIAVQTIDKPFYDGDQDEWS